MFGLARKEQIQDLRREFEHRIERLETQVNQEYKDSDGFVLVSIDGKKVGGKQNVTLRGKVEAVLRHLNLDVEINQQAEAKIKEEKK